MPLKVQKAILIQEKIQSKKLRLIRDLSDKRGLDWKQKGDGLKMEENRNQHNQSTDFMKETIKQRPLNRKKLLRRTLLTAAMAMVFGLVACLTFLLLEPVISNRLYPEEEPSTVVFVEENKEDEILPEDMIVEESQILSESTEAPALEEEQIEQVLSEMKLGTEDCISLSKSLYEVVKEVQKSIVTVVGVTSDVDWFNNAYENEGMISGVIIADNGRELLMLADMDAIEAAESFKVTFADNSEYPASLKKKDPNTGLAVLSVSKSLIKRTTSDAVKPVNLGTSAVTNLVGTPVIAVGQPMGMANSLGYGFVTSAGNVINLPDSAYKLVTTDIYGSKQATGILVNLKGQMIGMIDMVYQKEDIGNLVCGIGITELKKMIQSLSNDEGIAYLGIYGADVTKEANEEMEVPFGAYVMKVDMDSPAMEAGLQSGDVITRLGEMEITTYQVLVNALFEYQPEQTVSIGLLRQGPDGYTEMELQVVLGD